MTPAVAVRRRHGMPFGAEVLVAGGVRFRLWAPSVDAVRLQHGDGVANMAEHAMTLDDDGFHAIDLPAARAGDRYAFRLPDGLCVPDPASRFNPDDVHAPSAVVDPAAYAWGDAGWTGRPWHEAVVYELHIGAFTPEGTFAAARARLAWLAELGITAVELMPLADFPGQRNWGYDGVLPYAPDAAYGTPDELKALIDAAHGLEMMVLIDVVYNHFGPEGNYLHAYCPQFFNPAHQTPWGAAINFDGDACRTVRDFFVHNALYWAEEFHVDGLRMDAIHAIRDDSPRHVVREICAALHDGPGRDRHIHVVLENERNEAAFLSRDDRGHPLAGTAQWNDDLHHAAHVLVTREIDGYYVDFADRPVERFGLALAEGFVYQGQPSAYRDGAPRGEPSTHLPLGAFVSFMQTHDQVGNRAFGERIQVLGDPVSLRAAYACLLLSPHTPMLFMGEEFDATTPFQYFCDFGPELAAAVSRGRREEFGRFSNFGSGTGHAQVPDPNDESTFFASRLDWSQRDDAAHAEWTSAVRRLLALRRDRLVPRLAGQCGGGRFECDGDTLRVSWPLGPRNAEAVESRWHLLAHFGQDPACGVAPPPGTPVYSDRAEARPDGSLNLARGAVHVTLQEFSDV